MKRGKMVGRGSRPRQTYGAAGEELENAAGSERARERERDRQTDRQTDRETETERHRQRDTQTVVAF